MAVTMLVLLVFPWSMTASEGQGHALGLDIRADLSRLETLILVQDARLQQLERDNQQLKEDNQKLQDNIEMLHADNQELHADNQKLQSVNQKLQNTVSRLVSAEQEHEGELARLNNRNSELDSSILALSHKVFVLESQALLAPANKPQDSTESQTNQVTHDVAARADDVNSLQPVVDQLSQRVTEVSADIQSIKNVDQQHSHAIQQAATSTYTRWGHSACPASNDLVYSGVVGGSMVYHKGAATNYLCLTLSPVLSSHLLPQFNAFLYGSEYETDDSNQNMEPLCAVCRSPRPNTIMIPGTNVCVDGWTLEYSGYLMAERYDVESGAEYVCVDSALKSLPGSDANQPSREMHFTVTQCGSLPCGPYANNKIVTCAVCSL